MLFHFQFYRFIEIAIRQCKSSGIDCKVHGLTIRGQLKTDDDDLSMTLSYLASDNEEESFATDKPSSSSTSLSALCSKYSSKKLRQSGGSKDIHTHVFVWGLNDKDQLGGPKGSKVGQGFVFICLSLCLSLSLCCLVFSHM